MLIFFNWKWKFEHVEVYKLTCMLNSYVVHCDYGSFGWTINQISFWGEKKPFQQVAWWTASFIFLILTLAAAQQVFKNYNAVAAPRHCHWWVQLVRTRSTILAKFLWGNVDSCNRKQNSPDKWYAMQISLSISWWLLNTFLSIWFKFNSKLSSNRLPQRLQVRSNSVSVILTLAAAQQVFKNYNAVAAPRHCHWWVQLVRTRSTILAKFLWGNVDSCNRKQNSPDKWYAMQISLSISWWLLNTFLSIWFKFDSKLSSNRLPQRLQVRSNSVSTTHISIPSLQVSGYGYVQENPQNKNTLSDFFLPLQMHVQNHERVQKFCFYPFKKKLKENPDCQ